MQPATLCPVSRHFYSSLLPISAFLLLVAPVAQSCLTCHDFSTDDGYNASQLDCNERCKCCSAFATEEDFLTELHPGFSTSQQNGAFVVSAVIPWSPAERAGILVNDVILQVNGERYSSLSCESQKWASKGDSHVSHLLIRRGAQEREIAVRLVPIRVLLAAQWITQAESSSLLPARFVPSRRSESFVGIYSFGLRFEAKQKYSVVTAVLRASPASKAGLRVGDKILSLQGTAAKSLDELVPVDRRYTTEILVQRGSRTWTVMLTSVGISDIVRDLGAATVTPIEISEIISD